MVGCHCGCPPPRPLPDLVPGRSRSQLHGSADFEGVADATAAAQCPAPQCGFFPRGDSPNVHSQSQHQETSQPGHLMAPPDHGTCPSPRLSRRSRPSTHSPGVAAASDHCHDDPRSLRIWHVFLTFTFTFTPSEAPGCASKQTRHQIRYHAMASFALQVEAQVPKLHGIGTNGNLRINWNIQELNWSRMPSFRPGALRKMFR